MITNSYLSDILWAIGELLFVLVFAQFWYFVYKYKSIYVYTYMNKKELKYSLYIILIFFFNLIVSLILSIYS